jgi:hypothetical protein
MHRIYGSPDYSMGAVPATNVQATKKQAEAALKQMQHGLKSWLKVRKRMDGYVVGQVRAPELFRRAKPLPPAVVAKTLRADRYRDEQDLAETLYSLLTECGADAASLPAPDVAKDPDAAAKLAVIAINGKTPSEVASPAAQGFVWFVLAIPVAGVVLVISQMIKSKADVVMQKEQLRCIESGGCTDYGFWLKVGAIAVTAWLAWDKFGVREAVQKRMGK